MDLDAQYFPGDEIYTRRDCAEVVRVVEGCEYN